MISLLLDGDTCGPTHLLAEMLKPILHVMSMHITYQPRHLEIAEDVSMDDAPFRIVFISFDLDEWESSGIDRLDQLSVEHRHSPLRGISRVITIQGCTPPPSPMVEQRILPRLKLTTMPPNFDFTKLRQNLIDNDDDETRIRLLKGLHERLWHELYPGMERFLKRLGVPDRCLTLCRKVIEDCPHCHAYKPVPRRPKFGAELAGHFGDCLVVDLFFIWGHSFLIMVDEATRFKVSALLPTKDAKTLMKTMLAHWFRYFGPPRTLRSDQEGGIRADDFGLACDRFSIHRSLAGSDDTGQHTSTG